jgi:hypothetical protein
VKFAELFAALAKAAGVRGIGPTFRPLPAVALWPLAALAELAARVTGKPAEPSFELVRVFTRDWFASSARAENGTRLPGAAAGGHPGRRVRVARRPHPRRAARAEPAVAPPGPRIIPA